MHALSYFLLPVIASISIASANPNVAVLLADELPENLAMLRSSGLSLEKFHITPDIAATSASLLTGRYHYRTGVASSRSGESEIHGYEMTLAEVLVEVGYKTYFAGDWAHGDASEKTANAQGFQTTHLDPKRVPEVENGHPFLLWSHVEKITEMELASWLGQLPDETITIVAATRAPMWGAKFYGGQDSVHEGGVRSRCFISWSGRIPPRTSFNRLTAHIDLYPTILELVGIEPPEKIEIDGESTAAILLAGGERVGRWPNRVFCTSWTPPEFNTRNASVAVRTDRWLAVREPRERRAELAADRHGWELYDLMSDPAQRYDVADDFPFLLGELKADYMFWMDHTTEDGFN